MDIHREKLLARVAETHISRSYVHMNLCYVTRNVVIIQILCFTKLETITEFEYNFYGELYIYYLHFIHCYIDHKKQNDELGKMHFSVKCKYICIFLYHFNGISWKTPS